MDGTVDADSPRPYTPGVYDSQALIRPMKGYYDGWKYRRRMTFLSAGFLMLSLAFLMVFGDPGSVLHQGMADNGLWALVALVGIYIGAPVADDWLQSRKR